MERERCRIESRDPFPEFRDAIPIDRIVQEVVRRVVPRETRWGARLSDDWKEMVGGTVAAHTRPGRLDGSVLYVYVDSSVWLHELKRYGRRDMLANIRRHLGDGAGIRSLRFVPDPG